MVPKKKKKKKEGLIKALFVSIIKKVN